MRYWLGGVIADLHFCLRRMPGLEERTCTALGEIERAARDDTQQQRGRCGQQDGEAERDRHAGDGEDRRALGGLRVERGQQAQVVEGGDAAVDEPDDGESEHALLQRGGEDIELGEEAAGEGNADEREQEEGHGAAEYG